MALKLLQDLGTRAQSSLRGNLSLGFATVNTDARTATTDEFDVTTLLTNGSETAVRRTAVPAGTRFIDFHLVGFHTAAITLGTGCVLNVFGRVPVSKGAKTLPEQIAGLTAAASDNLEPFGDDPYFLPLYDPENSTYDVTLPTTKLSEVNNTSDYRAIGGRAYVLAAGCTEILVPVKTANSGGTVTDEVVVAHFWA